MNETKKTTTNIVELGYDKREETLVEELKKIVNERGRGLTYSTIVGIFRFLEDHYIRESIELEKEE